MTQAIVPEATEIALAVDDLRCSFGGVRAVDGVTFSVNRGEAVGLIGANGAGKSTVCSLIGGSLKPDAGSVTIAGRVTTGWPPHEVARAGLIRTFQSASDFPRLSVLENLLVGVPIQKGDSLAGALLGKRYWAFAERESVSQARMLLERTGLLAVQDEYAGRLSGGQKRILDILRAVMGRPQVLLIDEPMAGVHPSVRRDLTELLHELNSAGMTILLVEHELGIIERVCQSVVVMARGKVTARGPAGPLLRQASLRDAYDSG